MKYYLKDNIAAIATANGYAGVGIIRISGVDLLELMKQLTNLDSVKPRYCHYCSIYDESGDILDSAVVIYFQAPNSFTGEDIIEIQGHGSPILLKMILSRCVELGCRLAEAGEFSKRAYLNGKIDLLQSESISDLIHAESEASVRGSQKSLRGEFSKYINQISSELINLRMFVEASIDFPEEDIEFIQNAKIYDKLSIVRDSIHALSSNTRNGVILNNGINLVIIGQPNVGKSSLMNALAAEEIAIVTNIAGTTRDTIQQKIIIDGVVFNLIDTAGIRDTSDIVEKLGINRAITAMQKADICLVLLDSSIGLSENDNLILSQIPNSTKLIFVQNKIDKNNKLAQIEVIDKVTNIFISAQYNLGLDLLRQELLRQIGFAPNENIFIARSRHMDAMNLTVKHIDNAFSCWSSLEVLAEELRYAHNALMQITGEFSSDDLLGEIFSKFCIGK